jgi:hypothetical protein
MHVKARLLNRVSNVWTCECQVLQSTGIAAILSGVIKESTFFSRQFASYVDQCTAWITVNHAGTLEKFDSVLPLRKHHAGRSPCNRDAEKEG